VPKRRFAEIKRRPNGREERFDCQAVRVTEDLAVASFRIPVAVGPVPKGSTTLGFFWRRRNYNLYRFLGRDGDVLLHRFDVVDEVEIDEDSVAYTDLYVDVLVSPTGEVTIEDEDELRRAAARGQIDDRQVAAIERALRTITRDWRRIVREALSALPEER
jgi:predicted RNA-binding protein associated with RNAse of E/G family